jgi:preprotein translocase subunit SecD
MNKNIRGKVIFILAILVIFSGVGVYPILASQYGWPMPGWLAEKQLKLGLDLRGGVHLVLRVETEDALRLETQTEMERLREGLKTAGVNAASLTQPSSTQFKVEGVSLEQDALFRTSAKVMSCTHGLGAPCAGVPMANNR